MRRRTAFGLLTWTLTAQLAGAWASAAATSGRAVEAAGLAFMLGFAWSSALPWVTRRIARAVR